MKSRPKSANPRLSSSYLKRSLLEKVSARCELDRSDIPPICDNEHRTGDCYCYLCTCGKHQCPNDYQRKVPICKSQFSTHYKQNYKKQTSKIVIQKPIPEFKPAHFPLDSLTTTKKDFSAPEMQKTEPYTPTKTNDYTSLKFIGKTNYSSHYPVWKELFSEKTYCMENPRQLYDSKFANGSSYQENYRDHCSMVFSENNNFAKKMKEKARGSFGIISASSDFLGKSTQKSDYLRSNTEKPALAQGKTTTLRQGTWQGNFQTTYSGSFGNPVFSRLVKKKSLKRNKP